MRANHAKHRLLGSIREIVFGLEDSLVSTLGTITGIAAGTQSTYIVLLSGLVLIAVEATSMSAGSYLSSKSAAEAEREIAKEEGKDAVIETTPLRAAIVMGIFYFLGGFVPLAPYFFLPVAAAVWPSVAATVVILFLVGVWSAKVTKRSVWKGGVEMVVVSIGAAILGYLIGRIAHQQFGVQAV